MYHVIGEIYEIDDKMLQMLDKLERTPDIYLRQMETVQPITPFEKEIPLGQHGLLQTWAYVFHTFNPDILKEEMLESYTCNNYDVLRSLSGKVDPELRRQIMKIVRGEDYVYTGL